MYISGVIAAFFIALFIAGVFSIGFKHNGPWGAFWIFFVILFLLVWAGQLWMIPFGPAISGTSWIPLFFLGLIFAFALIAPGISKKDYNKGKTDVVSPAPATVGIFFWGLFILLLLAIISGYFVLPIRQ